MGGIIGGIICIYLLYLFIVHVLPILVSVAGIVALVIAGIAILVGGYHAFANYFRAIYREISFRHWTWKNSSEPARRSYFFGPGYVQLKNAAKRMFQLHGESGDSVLDGADFIRGDSDGIWGFLRKIGSLIYIVLGYVCIYVIGTVLCVSLLCVHGAITTAFMLLYYVIFTILWLVDRIYLLAKRISSVCPVCKERYLIPVFICPDCGERHFKLVPGPYGAWRHRCNCGKKLPATFFGGRHKLQACCPLCHSDIVASDARPVEFQLVGGSQAGKSVYLASFFHQFLKKAKSAGGSVTIPSEYQPYFDDMENWYQNGYAERTTEMNAQMYPILLEGNVGTKRQFSIYDIAGEMFNGVASESAMAQLQFKYCDGILFVFDPLGSAELGAEHRASGEYNTEISDMRPEAVVTNFINYLVKIRCLKKTSTRSKTPVAVLIAKSDVREVKRSIGPAKIQSVFKQNPELYGTLAEARDGECRKFLMEHGFTAAIDELEGQFANIHYFPISAMGHAPDGSEFEPWGVSEPMEWLLSVSDKELAGALHLSYTP